jgi:mono/diheme cytochrome c family protein
MFSNVFTQTADVSDLPNSIKLAPDGTFVIAKGGQRRKTYSRDSGTVLRISADGSTATVLGHGFRQPFVGVHPRNGMVTASDQDGHNVPATPIYIVDQVRDHGYPRLKTIPQILEKAHLPTEYPASMAEPVVWMPRSVNSSGITQVWLVDARMGPLNDALIHIGYNRPELLVVRFSDRTSRRQAAVYSLTRDLLFPPLSGSVNPRDGQLYVAGFNLNNTERISHGLARVRHTGKPYVMPREVIAMDQGILLRFDVPLDEQQATNRENYSVARWNYKRTPNYASPPYLPNGKMGKESLTPSSAYLSADRKSVFVGVPEMQPAIMQLQVNWTIASRDGLPARGEAVLSPIELAHFSPHEVGFGDLKVDLTPAPPRPVVEDPVSAAGGGRLARSIGCYGCHSTDGSKGIGPSWKGLAGSLRVLKGGEEIVADEAYLRESILFPTAKIVDGYEEAMPGFAGIMGEAQVNSLILYIQSLQYRK